MATVVWTNAADAVWRAVAERGWLGTHERVVVHVGGAAARPAARALVACLRRAEPARRVQVIDVAAAGWDVPLVDLDAGPRWTVDAACLRGGVAVPALWLESFALVRVVAPAPDPRLGLSAVLAAGATLLTERGRDLDRLYEAHRLLAADVNVAAGAVVFGEPASGEWWAASDGDLALEAAVAIASGRTPALLPALRHITRHELGDAVAMSLGPVPALRGHLSSPVLVRLGRLIEEGRHAARTAAGDLRAAAANLHRARGFVSKRLRGVES